MGRRSISARLRERRPNITAPPTIRIFKEDRALTAANLAILHWPRGGERDIIIGTDNQNATGWISRARANSPTGTRILRGTHQFFCRRTRLMRYRISFGPETISLPMA